MSMVTQLGRILNLPPVSIEQLPGDGTEWLIGNTQGSDGGDPHLPFLFVESNLGIPQKALYKIYMEAVSLFLRYKHLRLPPHSGHKSQELEDLIQASSVVLLGNPSHQTALNTRKRLVQLGLIDARHELRVTAALLTLRDCSKQSILWHHRRWLLRRILKPVVLSHDHGLSPTSQTPSGDSLLLLDIPPEALRDEFSITSKACETYERNYYAWAHRYMCLEALAELVQVSTSSHGEFHALLMTEAISIRHWVEQHISDYTAVQHLHHVQIVLRNIPSVNLPREALSPTPVDGFLQKMSQLHDILQFVTHAESLIEFYPDHETLWLYLRAVVSGCLEPTMRSGFDEIRARTLLFSRRFFLHAPADYPRPLSVDERIVHRHASRFIAWLARQDGNSLHDPDIVRRIVAAEGSDQYILTSLFRDMSFA